ncbi:hypothetical protein L195_g049573, partial [Trifolium pratense]
MRRGSSKKSGQSNPSVNSSAADLFRSERLDEMMQVSSSLTTVVIPGLRPKKSRWCCDFVQPNVDDTKHQHGVLSILSMEIATSSKANSKELERIDSLFYTYANGSSGLI